MAIHMDGRPDVQRGASPVWPPAHQPHSARPAPRPRIAAFRSHTRCCCGRGSAHASPGHTKRRPRQGRGQREDHGPRASIDPPRWTGWRPASAASAGRVSNAARHWSLPVRKERPHHSRRVRSLQWATVHTRRGAHVIARQQNNRSRAMERFSRRMTSRRRRARRSG